MTKLKLYYSGHIMRGQGFFWKRIMRGRMEGSRKKWKTKYQMGWLHKEAIDMCLQSWAGLLKIVHCGHHPFIGSPGVRADSLACNTHMLSKFQRDIEGRALRQSQREDGRRFPINRGNLPQDNKVPPLPHPRPAWLCLILHIPSFLVGKPSKQGLF